MLCGQAKRSRKTELARRGRNRNRSGAFLQQIRQSVRSSQIGLLHDAGLAIDAGTLDDVIVELVAFLLADERRHIG